MDPNSYSSPGIPPKVLIAIVGGLLLLVIIIYIAFSSSLTKKNNPALITPTASTGTNGNNALPTRSIKPNEIPQNVVAKVGKEYIYDQDVKGQEQDYLNVSAEQVQRVVLEKLTNESIILQAAEAEGLISLDPTIFNSTTKDIQKRTDAVNSIIGKVKGQATAIQGDIVSIWFYNQGEGAVGYEKGKEIAFQKMSQLHAEVKAGRMTMAQAADSIRNDISLAQVDSAYQMNAGLKFNSVEQQRITISKEFNDKLWQLKEGEVTDLFVAKDAHVDTNELIDAFYMFGQVNAKQGNTTIRNFDEWMTQKKKTYAVTLY